MTSPQPPDSWQLGNPYEQYVGRWSRRVAPAFLAWLKVPERARWLDVGCGTGALAAAILAHCAPASVTGVEPSEGLLKVARESLPREVTLCPGNAAAIPLPDSTVNAMVAGLVLNFIPDLRAALNEIARVATPGARFGAYVWDYAGKMELMRYFWDAAVALDPDAIKLDEGVRFPLCRPEALLSEIAGAGFHDVEVTAIDVQTPFSSFQDYWEPFLGGQGPAPAYVMSLDEPTRMQLRDRLRDKLPVQADGSISLVARAWAVRATV
jgi:SAM-dependent methyltransferase